MRITYVADGASAHTQRLVNYFAQKGHEVHLICWRTISGYENNVRFHLLTRLTPQIWPVSQYFSFLFWIIQVRWLIKKIKPDVVDGHFITVYGFLAACAGFHPLLVTAWGSDILIQSKRNPLWAFLAKHCLKKADLVVCRSPIVKEEISKLGVEASKIRIILIGANTTVFQPMPSINKLRQKLGTGSLQPVVITTRRLSQTYDVETLIKAIPLVLAEVPSAKFVVAGDGEQRGYLQKLAQSLGISDSARFVGWIPHQELPKYLASADIYVSTSLSDGTSNSLLEAMACGLAPVVTDIPANKPWINQGKNGFLFPVKDPKALATKIIDLTKNEERRKAFGRISRKVVQSKAEQKIEMGKLGEAYQESIATRIKNE